MIGRKSQEPKRGALVRGRVSMLRSVVTVAMSSLAGLALMVPVASASGVPTATTEAASGASYQKVTLNGTVNPDGLVTSYHFEYGKRRRTARRSRCPTCMRAKARATSN